MAIFKLYDCDIGVTIRGSEYFFEHVDEVTLDDPERNGLTRGGNAGNKIGIDFKEGIKEPKTISTSLIGMPADLHNLLKDVFKTRERVDFYVVARSDGSTKMAKNAILAQSPMQPSMTDGADSFNTPLVFQSFDVEEVHKS